MLREKSKILAFEHHLGEGGGGRGRKYSHILAIRVCSAGKGMAVFKPITLGWGLVIIKGPV